MTPRIVRSAVPLDAYPLRVGDDLVRVAREAPQRRPFILERSGERTQGPWVALTFGDALKRVRTVGAGLLAAGLSSEEPLAVLAENGIDYAVIALAAMYVGVPVSPVSAGYGRHDGYHCCAAIQTPSSSTASSCRGSMKP